MKDSYNYAGFSSTVVVSRKRKPASKKRISIVEADKVNLDNDPSKYYPPYLMQNSTVKDIFKK